MLLQPTRDKLRHYSLIVACLLEMLRARRRLRRRPFLETAELLKRPLEKTFSSIPETEQSIRLVRAALGSIYRHVPWKPTCLVRAVAANRILARRMVASNLVLSVAPASGQTVDAHAWLEAGGIVVTGRSEKAKYVPIYTFSNGTFSNAGTERAQPCSR
jgi:hypothetical protein